MERLHKNRKNTIIQTNLKRVLISWRKYSFNRKQALLNKYWGSGYFPVNDYWAVIFSEEYLLTVTPTLIL